MLISADIRFPENNREVFVLARDKMDGIDQNTDYRGYQILYPIDLRFIVDRDTIDLCTARVWGMNSVLIKVPSWPYCLLEDREEIVHKSHLTADEITVVDYARNEFLEDDDRFFKYIKLVFPDDHILSTKEINKSAGEEEWLPFELKIIPYNHPEVPRGINTFASWRVVRADLKPRKRGKSGRTNKSAAAKAYLDMKSKFESMNVDG